MGINKLGVPTALLLFVVIASLAYASDKRDWKQGTLISVEMIDVTVTPNRVEHRYQCVVSDGTYSYTLEYEHLIKAAVHRPVKFVIDKDRFVLLDGDAKERSARIEKRERVLFDPPGPRL